LKPTYEVSPIRRLAITHVLPAATLNSQGALMKSTNGKIMIDALSY
jgi:hypothetical protein